jgi:hypothetical protein
VKIEDKAGVKTDESIEKARETHTPTEQNR